MKVTDCGCFGDFLKLEPFTSFMKDLFLLIPGLLFILFRKKMHTLVSSKAGLWTTIISTILVTVYCFSNYIWDIPHADFRPFKEGVDIQKQKQIEEDAQAEVQVTGYLMQNKQDNNKKLEVSVADYFKYTDEWDMVDQIRTEPTLTPSKISEFDLNDTDGFEATYELLENEGKSIYIIAQKLKGNSTKTMKTIVDTITVKDEESEQEMQKFVSNEVEVVDFVAKKEYMSLYEGKLQEFTKNAEKAGYKIFFLTAGVSGKEAQDFINDTGINAKVFTGDDILLKTIIRSNPGVMLMDGAKIENKYHIRKLPSFQEISK
jgi:hypothetical protein